VTAVGQEDEKRSRCPRPPTSLNVAVQPTRVFVWDLEDILLISQSLIDGSYAHHYGKVGIHNYIAAMFC